MTLDELDFSQFAERGRRVVTAAHDEAVRVNCEYVGGEHLLIALAEETSGIAANVLKTFDVDAGKIRAVLGRFYVNASPIPAELLPLPVSPHAAGILNSARQVAQQARSTFVDTEHLLVGVLADRDGVAAQVLMSLGLKLDAIAANVQKMLDSVSPQKSATKPNSAAPQPYYQVLRSPLAENPQAMKGNRPTTHRSRPGWIAKLFNPAGRHADDLDEFSRFTDRARKVMQLADQEALRMNLEHVGTEHILLGLVAEGAGVGAYALKNFQVDAHRIFAAVGDRVPRGEKAVTASRLPLTPRARSVVQQAMEEAKRLKHNYVGTEHLLLGLLRETEGVAAKVLVDLGLNLDDVRREVLAILGHA